MKKATVAILAISISLLSIVLSLAALVPQGFGQKYAVTTTTQRIDMSAWTDQMAADKLAHLSLRPKGTSAQDFMFAINCTTNQFNTLITATNAVNSLTNNVMRIAADDVYNFPEGTIIYSVCFRSLSGTFNLYVNGL